MKTEIKNHPEAYDGTKKSAPGAGTPKADNAANAKKHITESIPENDDFVNNDFRQELTTLFARLSPEGKGRVLRFMELYHRDPDFSAAFDARFGDIEKRDYEEVCEFVNGWRGVAV